MEMESRFWILLEPYPQELRDLIPTELSELSNTNEVIQSCTCIFHRERSMSIIKKSKSVTFKGDNIKCTYA